MAPPGTLIVFAKVPVPGIAKTRLARELGPDAAARLARGFLLDTWEAVTATASARPVLALTGTGPLPRFTPSPTIWDQGAGDLGARMSRALHRATRDGTPAIVVGTDAPGRPPTLLAEALTRLVAGTPAVLGPTVDGGYHLIGVRDATPDLLHGLPWGSSGTLRATQQRLIAAGQPPHLLPTWYDVDEPADLVRLRRDLATGTIHAPHTASVFDQLELPMPLAEPPP